VVDVIDTSTAAAATEQHAPTDARTPAMNFDALEILSLKTQLAEQRYDLEEIRREQSDGIYQFPDQSIWHGPLEKGLPHTRSVAHEQSSIDYNCIGARVYKNGSTVYCGAIRGQLSGAGYFCDSPPHVPSGPNILNPGSYWRAGSVAYNNLWVAWDEIDQSSRTLASPQVLHCHGAERETYSYEDLIVETADTSNNYFTQPAAQHLFQLCQSLLQSQQVSVRVAAPVACGSRT
jgi:hypothetical protein